MATKIKNINILVTGSRGFIGSHLMKALGEKGFGYDVKITKRLDINDSKVLKEIINVCKPEAIVHLAAISNRRDVDRDPTLALQTNIIGSFNVMRIAHKYKIPVIIASSASVYEPQSSLYAATKESVEILAMMFPNVTIARLYNVYGPGSKSVVNKFHNAIQRSRKITLNGNTVRDYVHVSDVVASLLQLLDARDRPKLVEIGTGRGVSLKKLVSILTKSLKKDAYIVQGKPVHEIQSSTSNGPCYGTYSITLEQGIRRLL